MRKTKKTDIIISGAGLAGLSTALKLAQLGLNISVIDPITAPPKNALACLDAPFNEADIGTRTSALMNDNIKLLQEVGAFQNIEPYSAKLEKLEIIDPSPTKGKDLSNLFSADSLDLEQFGYNIPNKIAQLALYKLACKNKNIDLILKSKIEHYETKAAHIEAYLDNGRSLSASLIIGADGRNSAIRKLAAINAPTRASGQSALTCILNAQIHHDFTSTEFHYSGGPFTLVPLPNNYVSLVWVEKTEHAEQWLKASANEIEMEINRLSKQRLGKLKLIGGLDIVPLTSIQAERLTAPRIALMAEAAHVLHPMGAQGLNASLRDVQALSDSIKAALEIGGDIGSAATLKSYEKQRLADNARRNNLSFCLNKFTANNSSILKKMRRFGLSALEVDSPLRQIIMRYGLAPYK